MGVRSGVLVRRLRRPLRFDDSINGAGGAAFKVLVSFFVGGDFAGVVHRARNRSVTLICDILISARRQGVSDKMSSKGVCEVSQSDQFH